MANHMKDLSALKIKLDDWKIKDGQNLEAITDVEDVTHLHQNQQMVLESALHCCDISVPTRDFDVTR